MRRPPPEFPPPDRLQVIHDPCAAINYEIRKALIMAEDRLGETA